MANCMPPVIVRIGGANSVGKDWMIPTEVNFRMVLVSQAFFLFVILIGIHLREAVANCNLFTVLEVAPFGVILPFPLIYRMLSHR